MPDTPNPALQDIKPMLVFAAVLEHGSMNGAARALGMTPSAVSQHVARLESLHQVKLLNRTTRRLHPTDAGRALGESCTRLRQSLAETQATLAALRNTATGDLHLAITSSMVLAGAFQQTLHQLHEQYPGIQPVLHVSDSLTDLNLDSIDIALRGGEHALDDPDLIARHLCSWRWQICASPHYLARHTPITHPEQLAQHRWVRCLPIQSTLHRNEERWQLDIARAMQCSQLSAARDLCIAGHGLTMQLSGEIEQQVADGHLQVVLPDWTMPAINIYAVTAHRVQSARTLAAMQLMQQCFGQVGTAVA